MKKLLKSITVLVAVAGVIRFIPDFIRYMKMRSM
jgi:hypothetical protein